MKLKRLLLVLVPALLLVASAVTFAQGSPTVQTKHDAKLGTILADSQGKTLYIFTKDTTPGQSACYGQCAAAWPPLTTSGAATLAAGVPGTLGTITRTDGSKQVTYNGKPLYYFAKDEDAGDTYGQGIGGVWFVVQPEAAAIGSPAASPAAAATVQTKHDAKLGTILADSKGLTLYRFTKDTTPGQSACTGACAKAWPPLTTTGTPTLAAGVPGTLVTITRADGTKQVTYNGMPLYYYATDKDAGDTYGQGIGGVWFVVTPSAGAATPVTSSSPYSAPNY